MSQAERWGGRREQTYSHWHRQESVQRFLTQYQSYSLGMIDLDDVEWCCFCRDPIALIEATRYTGGDFTKNATVTRRLSRLASIPAFVVYYLADMPAVCECCRLFVPPWPDIRSVYVDGPLPSLGAPIFMLPDEYAKWLVGLRLGHSDGCSETQDWRKKNWRLWAESA